MDLSQRMVVLSRNNPRYGYRRVWALLLREGWAVNKKRVHRLWREAGLMVPASRERKRRRMGASENGCTRRRAEYPGHVWSYDFAMDATEDGRRVRIMPIVEEYSRECLALEVERSITAEDVIETLARLFAERRAPSFRANDPLWEAMMVLGLNRAENIQWQSTLRNLAAHFGANGKVETRVICVDPKRQWRHYKNIRHNILIRSVLRAPSVLVRKISKRAWR